MTELFNTILAYPILNLLVFFYNYIPDIGIVIILVTVVIRTLLLPTFHRSLKHQRALQAIQPKMQEIREKYKDNQEQQAKALMELYRVHKVNPLSSCGPVLVQLPILIALYQVFIRSLNGSELQGLYSFIQNPGIIDPIFIGFIDLASKGNYVLAAIAAVLQYFQTRMYQSKSLTPGDPTSKMMANYMLYFFPAITFIFGIQFPAGLALYWVVTTLFGIGQQYYIIRKEAREALYGSK